MSGFDDHFLHRLAFANGEGLKLLQDFETFQVVNTSSQVLYLVGDWRRVAAQKKTAQFGEVISHWPCEPQTRLSRGNNLEHLTGARFQISEELFLPENHKSV